MVYLAGARLEKEKQRLGTYKKKTDQSRLKECKERDGAEYYWWLTIVKSESELEGAELVE